MFKPGDLVEAVSDDGSWVKATYMGVYGYCSQGLFWHLVALSDPKEEITWRTAEVRRL